MKKLIIQPEVSVVIPIFNAEKFIKKTFASILKTNHPSFEVVIVDDCSTDSSLSLVKKYALKDSRVRLYINQTKQLAAGSRNYGCNLARGRFIALLDHDVEVDKNWIAEAMKLFKKYPDVSIVQGKVVDILKRETLQHAGIKINTYLGWVVPRGFGQKMRTNFNQEDEIFANATGLIFKKSVWKAVGGFDEDLAINTDDWDFNWKCWILGYRQRLAPKSITYHWSKKQQTRDAWIKRTKWEFHFAKVHYIFLKNYELKNIVKYLPVYLMINFGRGIFNLVFRFNFAPLLASFTSLIWLIMKLPVLLKKRQFLMSRRKIGDEYLIKNVMDNSFVPTYFIKHWMRAFREGKLISTETPY